MKTQFQLNSVIGCVLIKEGVHVFVISLSFLLIFFSGSYTRPMKFDALTFAVSLYNIIFIYL